MELMEAISRRRSTRKYDSKPVDRAIIEKLINTAVQAPSAMNTQPWAFGMIEGVDKLRGYARRAQDQLLATMDENSPIVRYRESLASPDYSVFYDAPALVVIYSRPTGPSPETDCAMAAQTFMLAARDMGLGTCWIGLSWWFFNTLEVKAELGVPSECKAIAPLIVGYPSEEMPPVAREAPQMLFWK